MNGKMVSKKEKKTKKGGRYLNIGLKPHGSDDAKFYNVFDNEHVKLFDDLENGASVTWEDEENDNGYMELKSVSTKFAQTEEPESKTNSDALFIPGNPPPIVSNILGSAVGKGGLITVAYQNGESIPVIFRMVQNLAWEASKGPSYADTEKDDVPF